MKEKQIEEMAKDIGDTCVTDLDGDVKGLNEILWKADIENIATELYQMGYRKQSENVIELPYKIGQTVYKICPKCNEWHNASCEHCAWRGCLGFGCDIGVRVYSDGSHNKHELQIVPRKVIKHNLITILELWNIMYFATEEEANTAREEYCTIRKIEDRHERYKAYKAWEKKRKIHYSFLEGDE